MPYKTSLDENAKITGGRTMSRKAFENYMALYWKLNGRWPDSESIWNSATAEQAEQLAIARQRISELEEINQEGIEQAERLGVKNFRQKQRIAELEKDCEILQTNLDAALLKAQGLTSLIELIKKHYKIGEENPVFLSGTLLKGDSE